MINNNNIDKYYNKVEVNRSPVKNSSQELIQERKTRIIFQKVILKREIISLQEKLRSLEIEKILFIK